jgi:hypothetical protein
MTAVRCFPVSSGVGHAGTAGHRDWPYVVGPGYDAGITNVATRKQFVVDPAGLTSLHLTADAGRFPPDPAPGTWERTTLKPGAGREFLIVKTHGTLSKPAVRVGDKPYPLGATGEDALLVVAVAPKTKVLLEVGDHGHRQALDMRTGRRYDKEPGRYETIVEEWNTTNRAADRIGNYSWVRAGGRSYVIFVAGYVVKRLPWMEGLPRARRGSARRSTSRPPPSRARATTTTAPR